MLLTCKSKQRYIAIAIETIVPERGRKNSSILPLSLLSMEIGSPGDEDDEEESD